VKLFDFGLAKELRDHFRNDDGTYKMTGFTGSMRYMAPEVANAEPYNATCDSYSFSILLWEILALKTPYENYTPKTLRSKVYNGPHKRPIIDASWPDSIRACLEQGWSSDLHSRSSMQQICKVLKAECVEIRGGDESGLEHVRRRSTFVFEGRKAKPSQTANSKEMAAKKRASTLAVANAPYSAASSPAVFSGLAEKRSATLGASNASCSPALDSMASAGFAKKRSATLDAADGSPTKSQVPYKDPTDTPSVAITGAAKFTETKKTESQEPTEKKIFAKLASSKSPSPIFDCPAIAEKDYVMPASAPLVTSCTVAASQSENDFMMFL